ncbi:MAG: 30S ribosome-binding factor RbfA [Bacteroidetes bacterium]|nr:30S ribosome-binding factor RbfA [Bacteroidota bacterium]
MESIRQNKVGKLIQKELAEIFRSEARNLFGGAFITVTVVRLAPDMSFARVYLSIMNKEREGILQKITLQTKEIRKRLGLQVGKQLRIVPDLAFFIDDSLDYAMRINELLK